MAQPSKSYPTIFLRGTLFDRYPFLLPNLVCAVVLTVGVLIGILFLEETHVEKRHRRDPGLEAGRWLLDWFGIKPSSAFKTQAVEVRIDDYQMVAEDEPPPGYRTTEGSPHQPSSRCQSPRATRNRCDNFGGRISHDSARSAKKAFTRQVILNIIAFGILA